MDVRAMLGCDMREFHAINLADQIGVSEDHPHATAELFQHA